MGAYYIASVAFNAQRMQGHVDQAIDGVSPSSAWSRADLTIGSSDLSGCNVDFSETPFGAVARCPLLPPSRGCSLRACWFSGYAFAVVKGLVRGFCLYTYSPLL